MTDKYQAFAERSRRRRQIKKDGTLTTKGRRPKAGYNRYLCNLRASAGGLKNNRTCIASATEPKHVLRKAMALASDEVDVWVGIYPAPNPDSDNTDWQDITEMEREYTATHKPLIQELRPGVGGPMASLLTSLWPGPDVMAGIERAMTAEGLHIESVDDLLKFLSRRIGNQS